MNYEPLGFWPFGESDITKVAKYITTKYGGKVSEWETKIPTMYKAYTLLVKEQNFPIYSISAQSGMNTVRKVAELSAMKEADCLKYLAALEEMTKQGLIDASYLNPVVSQEYKEKYSTTSKIGDFISDTFSTAKEKADTTINKVLIAGVIGLGVYAVVKTIPDILKVQRK